MDIHRCRLCINADLFTGAFLSRIHPSGIQRQTTALYRFQVADFVRVNRLIHRNRRLLTITTIQNVNLFRANRDVAKILPPVAARTHLLNNMLDGLSNKFGHKKTDFKPISKTARSKIWHQATKPQPFLVDMFGKKSAANHAGGALVSTSVSTAVSTTVGLQLVARWSTLNALWTSRCISTG